MAKARPSKTNGDDDKRFVARIDPPHRIGEGRPSPSTVSAAADCAPDARPETAREPIAETPSAEPSEPIRPAPEMVLAAAGLGAPGNSAGQADERLRTQVEQLAGHLQVRQRELDRREALLNSQLASQESEIRAHRLWMREREAEVVDQEQQLRREIEELQQQLVALSAAPRGTVQQATIERGLKDREAELALRESRLDEWENRLAAESTAHQTARKRFAEEQRKAEEQLRQERQQLQFFREQQSQNHRRILASVERHRAALEQREARLDEMPRRRSTAAAATSADAQPPADVREQEWKAREKRVVQRERLLEQQFAELDRERRRFDEERAAERDEAARQQQVWFEEREQFRLELGAGTARLQQRAESLETQRQILEQLQAELHGKHREVLELRLAAEQTWAQICGQASPASATQVLAGIRRQIAEEQRDILRDLTAKKQELHQLAAKLEMKRSDLQTRQLELQEWQVARQRELEEHAARLQSRERELERIRAEGRQLEREWGQEKRGLLRQIRELQARELQARETQSGPGSSRAAA